MSGLPACLAWCGFAIRMRRPAGLRAISAITSKCGGRRSRVTVSQLLMSKPALVDELRQVLLAEAEVDVAVGLDHAAVFVPGQAGQQQATAGTQHARGFGHRLCRMVGIGQCVHQHAPGRNGRRRRAGRACRPRGLRRCAACAGVRRRPARPWCWSPGRRSGSSAVPAVRPARHRRRRCRARRPAPAAAAPSAPALPRCVPASNGAPCRRPPSRPSSARRRARRARWPTRSASWRSSGSSLPSRSVCHSARCAESSAASSKR